MPCRGLFLFVRYLERYCLIPKNPVSIITSRHNANKSGGLSVVVVVDQRSSTITLSA